jgi:hypothetical protein
MAPRHAPELAVPRVCHHKSHRGRLVQMGARSVRRVFGAVVTGPKRLRRAPVAGDPRYFRREAVYPASEGAVAQ